MPEAVDLFAGAGGWDEGAKALGLSPLGVEWDESACLTREAAGHRTLRADVSELDPRDHLCDLLIASPPCPTFSTAGDQQGRLLIDLLLSCAVGLSDGRDTRAATREAAYALLLPSAKSPERARRDAGMSVLVVEPLRWALALRPEVVACEQVPGVLPLWVMFAGLLERHGYRTWCGVLNAADYGVPQTRRRAFLLASRVGSALPPAPTHCKGGSLSLDGDLAPWVSMAEALGWLAPGVVNTRGQRTTPGGNEFDANDPSWSVTGRARSWTQRSGQSVAGVGRAERSVDEPSVTIHSRADLNAWTLSPGVTDSQPNRRTYALDEPAPTIGFGHDAAGWACQAQPVLHTNRGQDENGERQVVDGGRPAPAVSTKSGGQWYWGSPAIVVAGDPRITARTHHEHGEQGRAATSSEDARNGDYDGRSSIRITLQEAAILQGFDPTYPWQGSRTKQFEQVGNAVPPPLAHAILAKLLS